MASQGLNCHEFRAKCRLEGLEPSWRVERQRTFLGRDEMESSLRRFECSRRASAKFKCDVASRPPAPGVVHMFWDDADAMLRGDGSPSEMPKHCLLGVWSACQVGLKVHLWAYSKFRYMFRHSNLVIRDAGEILSLCKSIELLRRGLRVQHLSDLVRCLAVQDYATRHQSGSWIADVDAVWLRPCWICPSSSGHVFTSMHAKRDTTHRLASGDIRYWKTNWVRVPDERLHLAIAPMALPLGSPVLASALSRIRALFDKPGDLSSLPYTAVVKIFVDCIRVDGLQLDVVDPIAFHPVPHFVAPTHVFKPEGFITKSHGLDLHPFEEVFEKSYVVSQTWFSWTKCSTNLEEWRIQPLSLYDHMSKRLGLGSWASGTLSDMLQDFDAVVGGVTSFARSAPVQVSTHVTPGPGVKPRECCKARRIRLVTKSSLPPDVVRVFLAISKRLWPGALMWEEWLPMIASCKGAVPPEHLNRAQLAFAIERELRLRLPFVRRRQSMPSTISVWSCALAQWRSLANGELEFLEVGGRDVVVDCLLSFAVAQSPRVSQPSILRKELRREHTLALAQFDKVLCTLVKRLVPPDSANSDVE